MITLGEFAERLGLPLGDADPALPLEGIGDLATAGPRQLAFVADAKYLDALAGTRAACVLLREEWAEQSPVPVLLSNDPYLAYARATALFDTEPRTALGVHPDATVDAAAMLGADVRVGPRATIGAHAQIGDGAEIQAGAHVGEGVQVGAGCRIHAGVVLYPGVEMGENCTVNSGSVIGSPGFGFARGPNGWEKIHQLGRIIIGNNVDIGAGATLDRGALGDTVIADGVIIDNQVHLAHNCRIGERTAIAGCVGFAGSTTVGADCTFAGQVGVSGHLHICDNAHFTGQARVGRSIEEAGAYGSGTPLEPMRQWRRNAVRFSQLDDMSRRVRELEKQLQELQAPAGDDSSD